MWRWDTLYYERQARGLKDGHHRGLKDGHHRGLKDGAMGEGCGLVFTGDLKTDTPGA